jgi:hypothetical protein
MKDGEGKQGGNRMMPTSHCKLTSNQLNAPPAPPCSSLHQWRPLYSPNSTPTCTMTRATVTRDLQLHSDTCIDAKPNGRTVSETGGEKNRDPEPEKSGSMIACEEVTHTVQRLLNFPSVPPLDNKATPND